MAGDGLTLGGREQWARGTLVIGRDAGARSNGDKRRPPFFYEVTALTHTHTHSLSLSLSARYNVLNNRKQCTTRIARSCPAVLPPPASPAWPLAQRRPTPPSSPHSPVPWCAWPPARPPTHSRSPIPLPRAHPSQVCTPSSSSVARNAAFALVCNPLPPTSHHHRT